MGAEQISRSVCRADAGLAREGGSRSDGRCAGRGVRRAPRAALPAPAYGRLLGRHDRVGAPAGRRERLAPRSCAAPKRAPGDPLAAARRLCGIELVGGQCAGSHIDEQGAVPRERGALDARWPPSANWINKRRVYVVEWPDF